MLKICYITAEFTPLAKTGGLGDVAAGLTRALLGHGQDVRVFLPFYRDLDTSGLEIHGIDFLRDVPIEMGWRHVTFSVVTARLPHSGQWIYLVSCPELYDRSGLYRGDGDEHVRFGLLARAAIESCQRMGWAPDVFHSHDWHTALVPVYLKTIYAWDGLLHRSRTALTIHNISYQGVFSSGVLEDLSLAGHAGMLYGEDLDAGVINFLKTGILHADVVTTVSRTYAHEIQTPEYGAGLHDLLRARQDHVVGIVNGVDYGDWNPETDELIPHTYSRDDMSGKAETKRAVLSSLSLATEPDLPLLGIVSRFTLQKGIELLYEPLTELLEAGRIRLVALGNGEKRYEDHFHWLHHTFPGAVCFHCGFYNQLAHWIEAASDIFLMPSLFEPCGLNQMYSLKYGTVPVVRGVGGLVDTVQHFESASGEGTGFVFEHYTPQGVRWALGEALATYENPAAWRKLVANGMARDFSWERHSREYIALFAKLCS